MLIRTAGSGVGVGGGVGDGVGEGVAVGVAIGVAVATGVGVLKTCAASGELQARVSMRTAATINIGVFI